MRTQPRKVHIYRDIRRAQRYLRVLRDRWPECAGSFWVGVVIDGFEYCVYQTVEIGKRGKMM